MGAGFGVFIGIVIWYMLIISSYTMIKTSSCEILTAFVFLFFYLLGVGIAWILISLGEVDTDSKMPRVVQIIAGFFFGTFMLVLPVIGMIIFQLATE